MRRLTVLGSCGVWPEAARACSGFLVEWDGFRVVMDLGFGTLPRLLAHCPEGTVDAVVITHEHVDHCVDLAGLARVRYFAEGAHRVPLYCTPGVLTRVDGLDPHETLDEVFEPHEVPGRHEVGPFRLDAIALPHLVLNAGIRLSTKDLTLAYTGDSMPDPALLALGKGADLFIVNATRAEAPAQGQPRGMLSAAEAGSWADRVGAKRLLLSHFWPGSDRAVAAGLASESFSGELLVAEEDLAIPLD